MQNLNYKTKFNKGLKFKRHKLLQNLTFKNVFKIILNIDLGMGFFYFAWHECPIVCILKVGGPPVPFRSWFRQPRQIAVPHAKAVHVTNVKVEGLKHRSFLELSLKPYSYRCGDG